MGIAQQFTCREPNDHFRRLPPPLVQQVVLGGVAKCVTGTTVKIMYSRDNMFAADTLQEWNEPWTRNLRD